MPAAETLPESPSHSPPPHAHQMPEAAARCRQRSGSPGVCPTDQAAMAWPDYHRADQTITATEASDHSSESIPGTENPMRIPS